MSRFSTLDLKLQLLRCFNQGATGQHRMSILGRPDILRGGLEDRLTVVLTPEERGLAARALRQLENDGLVRPTYRDMVDPENWLELTEAGTAALKMGTIDKLDATLQSIDPHFVEMRHGAWAAVESSEPDSIRQAAHSARELFTQILDKEAAQAGNRRQHIKAVMEKFVGHSKTNVEVQTQASAAEALYKSLHAIAHAKVSVAHLRMQVTAVLENFELALTYLLGVGRDIDQ